MMNAYVDQNFLINCTKKPELLASAQSLADGRHVRFVLSPWHFYEIGKSSAAHASEIILVAEALRPSWILERSDLLVSEFRNAWGIFYGFPTPPLVPIGSLAHVAATLLNEPETSLQFLTVQQFVDVTRQKARIDIEPALKNLQSMSGSNQTSFREGKFTREVMDQISVSYVNLMLARMQGAMRNASRFEELLNSIRRDTFTQSLIGYFIRSGKLDSLRAWRIESELSTLHRKGNAKLRPNRQLDRQHAIPALSYCDLFITNDKELIKLCSRVQSSVPFQTADVKTFEELLRDFS